ncbi:MAG: N-formylglutamate deformylase [Devosia sp. 67-54]|uniref:N-formylglutamate deformylase n=1 Tax=unclassified Devosia TaxID=196773 RepID=UPI00086C506B|nr:MULTISPECIES: N-formylglutamate deformylase [unclassified Devosia]MBN9306943.1 N-formylglutamate deformylase [Devosia sp.]ODU55198.1 MAG: N-formylglutamate deformylase [Acetobacteraceae bacterium SCN 69-10]OJX16963.1 MAG: N-formylglutamate deformylase [Devosia sp. 67-54]
MAFFELHRGTSPVILGFPHTGTYVPDELAERLNDTGRLLADTDWHIHELYADLLPGASTLRALTHRYVIDVNRGSDDVSLYPGQNTTGLVPKTDFDGKPIWKEGQEPDAAETARRLKLFHAPYHAALSDEIARVKAEHGVAIVFDCHSIRSNIPFLFAGKLPDLNIGTVGGVSSSLSIEAAAVAVAMAAAGYTFVLNGRFKGGWTTREYGHPEQGVHAIQLELAQDTHLVAEAPPFALDRAKADRLRVHLGDMLRRIENLAPTLAKAAS